MLDDTLGVEVAVEELKVGVVRATFDGGPLPPFPFEDDDDFCGFFVFFAVEGIEDDEDDRPLTARDVCVLDINQLSQ
jgi:hypothetical protein